MLYRSRELKYILCKNESLKLKFRYTKYGCKEVNKLELVKMHENNCEFKMCEDCGLAEKDVNKVAGL